MKAYFSFKKNKKNLNACIIKSFIDLNYENKRMSNYNEHLNLRKKSFNVFKNFSINNFSSHG